MKIKIIHQRLGKDSLYCEINNALSKSQFTIFRALVAYVSWGGICLIHEKLEAFYDRGGKVSLIIGIGDEGSEIDVLRYFKQRYPKADISVFHVPAQQYKFHPKVYIFSSKNKSLIFIGSNNLTNGGLFANSECCVGLEIDHRTNENTYNSINDLWKLYAKPKPPFFTSNLHGLSKKLFDIYSKTSKRKNKIYATRFKKELDRFFPNVEIPPPPKSNLQRQVTKTKKIFSRADSSSVLFLEILKETGASGTQVQIPREVIDSFFNVSLGGHQTIEINVESNAVRPAVICHFPNNTHRISFSEIANFRRPFLMKFLKKGQKLFYVKFIKGREYKHEITKCRNQTRYLAKRWRTI